MWAESPQGFVCLACAVNRRQEQTRIEAQWQKNNPVYKGKTP